MEEDELVSFRERWKRELQKNSKGESTKPRVVSTQSSASDGKSAYFNDSYKDSFSLKHEARNCSALSGDSSNNSNNSKQEVTQSHSKESVHHQPQYVSIAEGLLDGRTSPLLDRIQAERTRKRHQRDRAEELPQKKVHTGKKLLEQFIQDLVG